MKNITPLRSGSGRMLVNFGAGRNGWRASLMALGALIGLLSPLHATTTDTWTGAGSDNNWGTAANWGGTAPSANDILTFAGLTRLAPSNSFTAGTNFGGITFANGAGQFNLSGNAIDLTGNINNNANNTTGTETISLGLVLQGATTVTTTSNVVSANIATTLSGAISGSGPLTIVDANGTGNASTALSSASTTTLLGQNSYTGGTTLTGGTVVLNYTGGSTNVLGSGALTLGGSTAGGVAIQVVGNPGTQSVASTTLSSGWSTLSFYTTGENISLGAITANDGGTFNIVMPSTNTTTTVSSTNAGSNGILGGFAVWTSAIQNATVMDWVSTSGSTLGDFTGYVTSNYSASNWSSSANVAMTASQTVTSNLNINSLKLLTNGTLTLTLPSGNNIISTGGIMDLSSSAGDIITGGNLTSSAADLYVYTNGSSNIFSINSNITGSIGLDISPVTENTSGTVALGGTNTFNGNITVTRAILSLTSAGALPSGTSGGTISLNDTPGAGTATQAELLDNYAGGTITIAASNFQIQGNGTVVESSSGTLALTGNHTYTGPTSVSGGGTISTDTLANGGVASGIGASSNAASNLNLGGSSTTGTLIYTGSATTSTDRLLTLPGGSITYTTPNYIGNNGSGVVTFSNTGAIVVSSTSGTPQFGLEGSNTGNNTFDPIIANGGSSSGLKFTKNGTGTWILGGAETYTGTTTVSAGKLLIGTGGSLSSSTAVTVAAGATFGTASTNTTQLNIFSSTNTAALTLNLGTTIATQSNLEFNLFGGTNSDLLNAGTLTLNNATGSNTILLTLDNPTSATLSGPYNLLSWSGSTNLTVSEVSFAAGDPAGSLSVSNDTLIFTPTAVPEPSPWLLLLVGAGMLFVYRRSRVRDIS